MDASKSISREQTSPNPEDDQQCIKEDEKT